jgi:hypothetical protein
MSSSNKTETFICRNHIRGSAGQDPLGSGLLGWCVVGVDGFCRMVDYGSGTALDRFLDFQVGPTGDIKSVSGVDEVRKDVAYRLIGALRYGEGVEEPASVADGVVGEPITDGLSDDIAIVVSRTIEDDPRVGSVPEIRVGQPRNDRIEVEARIVLQDGETLFESFIISA